MIIAIDTSGSTASLALTKDGQPLAETSWHCNQNHSVQLLPQLDNILKRTNTEASSLTAIIVAIGPGSYNGLRVGISTAKGLASSLNIPLVGISTFEAEALQHSSNGLPICPITPAGRGEIAAAVYQPKDGCLIKIKSEYITTVDALCAETTEKTLFCGEAATKLAAELTQKMGDKAVIPTAAFLLRRAAFLAELGQKRLANGESDDAATLQPLYLRRPQITKPKKPHTINTPKI